MSDCTNDCSSCSENCSSRIMTEKINQFSSCKKVIGVVSGKGGVGKSLITSLLAIESKRRGGEVAILDGDVTGPSIPKIFGVNGHASGNDQGIFPAETKFGIKLISSNLLLENPTDPIVWRGAVISNMVKQFWTDVLWGDVDYMFVDMPPGTGDVPLTVFQSLPVDGIVIVTSPQELVSMIVEKAVKMAGMLNVPIIGVVENYAYLNCPDCGKKIHIFGESKTAEVCQKYGIKLLDSLPIDPELPNLCDKGMLELVSGNPLASVVTEIENLPNKEQ